MNEARDPEEKSQQSKDQDWIINAATKLGERFDSVQVFVTKHEGLKGSFSFHTGIGNWYARYGQVKDWVVRMETQGPPNE